MLKTPIKNGTEFDQKTMQYPVKVKVPFATFRRCGISERSKMKRVQEILLCRTIWLSKT